jgi:asparagine synthase (glutamine-hydrolysing)
VPSGAEAGARRQGRARGRGPGAFSHPAYVERLLENPNDERTPLGGNKLWQLGMMELWLQAHGI